MATMARLPVVSLLNQAPSEAKPPAAVTPSLIRRDPPPDMAQLRQASTRWSIDTNGDVTNGAQAQYHDVNRHRPVESDEFLGRVGGDSPGHNQQSAASGDSMAEITSVEQFGSAAQEQQDLERAEANPVEHADASHSDILRPKPSTIEYGASFSQETLDNAASLLAEGESSAQSKEDEELYYKLFPRERPGAEAALLEMSPQSFRIKVPVSDGKRMCLTEDFADFSVRAEPCRRKEPRQKWFWKGSKLQNLHSPGRCLGVDHQRRRIHAPGKDQKPLALLSNSLSMNFKCSSTHAPLTWVLTETGRLQSKHNNRCMAINESEHFGAMVLPCDIHIHAPH